MSSPYQQWDPYRAPRQPSRPPRPPWWRRRGTVVLAVLLVLFVGSRLSGGSAGDTSEEAAAGPTPSVPTATVTVTADPEPVEPVEPVDVVETPEVVEAPMPDLVGLKPRKAWKALTAADLVVGAISHVPSDRPVGTVLTQSVARGVLTLAGATVDVTVAAPYPAVPGVVGQARRAAERAVRDAGFEVRVRTERRTSGREGAVLRQSPAGSTLLAPGSVVTLVVAHVVAPPPPPEPEPEPVENCTPGYDPCLPPASDYDCAGGSGNGPAYAYGPIRVTGSDPYDLDSDGDGYGCE